MEIYLSDDFKCNTLNDGTMSAVETDAFDGKCDASFDIQEVKLSLGVK